MPTLLVRLGVIIMPWQTTHIAVRFELNRHLSYLLISCLYSNTISEFLFGIITIGLLHDRSWIWPQKSTSKELYVAISSARTRTIAFELSKALMTSLAIDFAVIKRASETRSRCEKIVVFIAIYEFVMPCKNNICTLMTVNGLTWILFCCLYFSLLRECICTSSQIMHYSSYNISN